MTVMEETVTCNNMTDTSSMSMDETGEIGGIYSPTENTENEWIVLMQLFYIFNKIKY